MTKQEIISWIDLMISKEQDHMNWMESKRLGKIGNFFFPEQNRLIDQFITNGNVIIENLKTTKIQYENSNINS